MQEHILDEHLECKICGAKFDSVRGMHLHISKKHSISQKEYYETYYPRKSLLNKHKISFKNYNQYFKDKFRNKTEFKTWVEVELDSKVKKYISEIYQERIKLKNSKNALSHIELELSDLPPIKLYQKLFGSYVEFAKQQSLNTFFYKKIPKDFWTKEEPDDLKIFIDTREQKPIKYTNSEEMKLDFGDYTSAAPHYDYTYIDRKSEADFKSTMSGANFERFIREINRARKFNSYLYVVVESDIEKIKKNNPFGPHKSKLPYIWHNVKKISQEHQDACQIIFATNRSGLKKIIPKLLLFGSKLWNTDVQFFLDKQRYEK